MADFVPDNNLNDGEEFPNGKPDSGSDAIVENIDSAAEYLDNNDADVVNSGDNVDDNDSVHVEDESNDNAVGGDDGDDGGDGGDNGNNNTTIINTFYKLCQSTNQYKYR